MSESPRIDFSRGPGFNPAFTKRLIPAAALAMVLAFTHRALALPWDAAPPTYHKITLNGRASGDKMPQDVDRGDQEEEESFVDALTLQLTHETTDIYVPVADNLPELMVRRNVCTTVWPAQGGLSPEKRPDLPFGSCWTSGLAANIHIAGSKPGEPVYAEATDEQGMMHRFVQVFDGAQQAHFYPLPSPNNEQETTAMTLEKNGAGDFVFRRKFGTTLVYSGASKMEIAEPDGGSGTPPLKHNYYRLATIENRAGSKESYVFHADNHGLIPDEIAYLTQRIQIEHNARGQVTRMIDPQGADMLCEYRDSKLPGGGELFVAFKASEIDGVRAVTNYDYDEANEPAAGDQPQYSHCDISRITDPRGKTYSFEYEFDRSTPEHGLPRCMRKVAMPDNIGVTEFFNLSKRDRDESKSVRMTFVRDAVGNGRLYRFLDNGIVTIDPAALGKPGEKIQPPQIAVFKRMEISNFQGPGFHVSDKGEFSPGPGTKLLGTEECDFDPGACMALVKTIDITGNASTYTYGDECAPPAAGMPANPLAVHRRDITAYVNAMGRQRRFEYDRATRLLARTIDENGRVTDNQIDSKRGLVLAERVYPDEEALKASKPFNATEYEYADPHFPSFLTRKTVRKIPGPGSPAWETDLVTKYEPDVLGRVAREIRNPGGLNATFRYLRDLDNNKISAIYPNGYLILFTYDARNRLVRVDRPSEDKPPRELIYDSRGNQIRETLPDGQVTESEYDGVSRLVKRTVTKKGLDHGPHVFKFSYNAVNAKIFNTTDEGETYKAEYDGLQRITKIIYADGTTYTYEYGKNCGSDLFESSKFKIARIVSLPEKEVIVNEYDPCGEKVSQTKTQRTSAAPAVTKFEYDPAGNLASETAPDGGRTIYKYDPLNRLVQTLLPDNKVGEETFYTSTGLKYATAQGGKERVEEEFDAAGYAIERDHEK